MSPIEYQYWFLSNEAVPYGKKYRMIEYFYDSYHIYHATESELRECRILTSDEIYQFLELRGRQDIQKEYIRFSRGPFSFITCEDDAFPDRLRNIYDPVYGVFILGKIPDLRKTVSIVGARNCTAYGKKVAFELGRVLGENGFTVISGMARGIDSHSHRGCLETDGRTIAVLGSGIDVIYPPENNVLYQQIAGRGAVISEYPIGLAPLAKNFPRRNRIVSGLSDTLIVVEAREKSGSLITADLALDQGKDIYIVPGRVGDALSKGCNRLATQGAGIIYSIEKFVEELSERYGDTPVSDSKKSNENKLTSEQKDVIKLFDYYPVSLASAHAKSNMDYLKFLEIVMGLVTTGDLVEAFRGSYILG